jgi:threonine/homoserine/homoserine lactone efflux protein
MYDLQTFSVFLLAAFVIAATPGSAIMYVAARTLAGGRGEGIASTLGTAVGGFLHVAASALGLSALLMTSANAFTVIKLAGAAYLIWLGVKMWREAGAPLDVSLTSEGIGKAFRDGIVVEILNPKMAAFFLAFLPQFIDPTRSVLLQMSVLGTIVVVLNSLADLIVIVIASRARDGLLSRPSLVTRIRQGSAGVMMLLGASLLMSRRTP